MKVLLHYEDNEENNEKLNKSLKLTLPKSWKTGPTQQLLQQFVESYNASQQSVDHNHTLVLDQLHLCLRSEKTKQLEILPSDAIVMNVIPDRADVYICHGGPSPTLADMAAAEREKKLQKQAELQSTVPCVHLGCHNRFPPNGPFPPCRFHKSPPVFHETAKFWSCCPHKKAYDWDTFQEIPGCQTGFCTAQKDDNDDNGKKSQQPTFLGGMDLREQAAGAAAVKLKSIDDFNKAQAAGGADAAPVLERLQKVLLELGVEAELYQQVVHGIEKEIQSSQSSNWSESQLLLDAVKDKLGAKLKAFLQATAAEQLRIK
jgi:CHORD